MEKKNRIKESERSRNKNRIKAIDGKKARDGMKPKEIEREINRAS